LLPGFAKLGVQIEDPGRRDGREYQENEDIDPNLEPIRRRGDERDELIEKFDVFFRRFGHLFLAHRRVTRHVRLADRSQRMRRDAHASFTSPIPRRTSVATPDTQTVVLVAEKRYTVYVSQSRAVRCGARAVELEARAMADKMDLTTWHPLRGSLHG